MSTAEKGYMATGQLWLFPPSRPLVERFGEEFFHALPTAPGVYLMCGEREGVLYVGKACNLRQRLSSYRVANPERLPRRIIRLLHQVRRIELDVWYLENWSFLLDLKIIVKTVTNMMRKDPNAY